MKKKITVGITTLFGGIAAIVAGYQASNIEAIGGGIASAIVGVIILLNVAGVIKTK